MNSKRCLSALLCLCVLAGVSTGETFQESERAKTHALVQKVKSYLEARKRGDEAAARSFYSDDSRIWFEKKEGPGRLRNRDGSGPWSDWDRFFNARSDYQDYKEEGDAVTVLALETNDFYRLIDRARRRVRLVYYFNAEGRVEGTLVAAVKDEGASKDRFDAFKSWAERNRPEELRYLMPDGEIVPDLDRAKRWRKVLSEWRAATGLPPIK